MTAIWPPCNPLVITNTGSQDAAGAFLRNFPEKLTFLTEKSEKIGEFMPFSAASISLDKAERSKKAGEEHIGIQQDGNSKL